MIDDVRKEDFPELSFTQILGYFLFCENRQKKVVIADIGWEIYNDTLQEPCSFNLNESLVLKHNLCLTKEQMRKIRNIMRGKNVDFPTTNELLEERKKLRPLVLSAVGGKGLKADYKET